MEGASRITARCHSIGSARSRIIDHISEVAKILDAAVRHDPAQAVSYAELLISKLDAEGSARQARVIRNVLSKTPARAVGAAHVAAMPVDQDSKLSTVMVDWPTAADLPNLVLDATLEEAIDGFVSSVRDRDRLSAVGIDIPSRLLLHGPPGTGKTSVARMVAAALQLPLITTRSDALVSSLLGQTSRNIRDVFDYAGRQPCVLFLDEFDALAKNRADMREVGELQRVVIALLENLDAFDDSSVLIAATNHPQLLDPAIWRRFSASAETVLPNRAQRHTLWRNALTMLEVDEGDLQVLAEYSDGMSGAAIRTAAMEAARVDVLAMSPKLRLPQALRKLARLQGVTAPGIELGDEVRTLRNLAPMVYTHRGLSETFGISTRQVIKHLKETDA